MKGPAFLPFPKSQGHVRLLLLRHGEVHADDCNALYGQADVRLSERGYAQAKRAGAALRDLFPISAVYTSDLVRASVLGKAIAEAQGIQPVMDQRLRERFFGDWQGLSWAMIAEHYPEELRRYEAARDTVRAPGGAESFQDVRARVIPAVTEILHRHANQTVAITAHGGPLRVILAEALGLGLDRLFTFEQDYCCLNVVDYHPPTHKARVMLMNSTAHLGELACGAGK